MPHRSTLLGLALLLAGSVAAGLVVLVPVVPVALGTGAGLGLLVVGLALVVRGQRARLDGLRLAVRSDPVLAELVPSRFPGGTTRVWDLLVAASAEPGSDVARLRDAVAAADDVDDLAARLGTAP